MFELFRWYGDCISDQGEVRIASSAELRYGGVPFNYTSLLDGGVATHSLRSARITETDGALWWESPGVSASWARRDDDLRVAVFRSEEGTIDWRCLMPKASASMNEVRGLGYAEHLRMTIAPWNIPIRTLRWGRFLTRETTLIWIDWQGEFANRIVFLNGTRCLAQSLDDDGLLLDNGARISLNKVQIIRQGNLGSTVFRAVPILERVVPARMFLVDECKWKSRAKMQYPGRAAEDGWCIHEVVKWP